MFLLDVALPYINLLSIRLDMLRIALFSSPPPIRSLFARFPLLFHLYFAIVLSYRFIFIFSPILFFLSVWSLSRGHPRDKSCRRSRKRSPNTTLSLGRDTIHPDALYLGDSCSSYCGSISSPPIRARTVHHQVSRGQVRTKNQIQSLQLLPSVLTSATSLPTNCYPILINLLL